MNNPTQTKPTVTKSAHVETVVQEYMDNLLVDLFPDVAIDTQPALQTSEEVTADVHQSVVEELTVTPPILEESVIETTVIEAPAVQQPIAENVPVTAKVTTAPNPVISEPLHAPQETQPAEQSEPSIEQDTSSQIIGNIYAKPDEQRYPMAPAWAQQSFDVLLFDVCGLKLAVPMESLGKIIKVEHETSQLIGRPDWFIGAYTEHEQHLYVVDTARYIMPEKGFDLANDGFEYVIQLQRSKWTLACKKVHSTVRLQPDQVKWRSQLGKRKWLSGTVVDHMCALIHVDSLIELLEAEAK